MAVPVRNREKTKQRILEAVGALLAESGFRGIGINAVARRAGADKVLIYRYFGGLAELLDAYAHDGDFWWGVEEIAPPNDPAQPGLTAEAYVALLLERHVEALRRRPLTLEIMAWEMVETNELTRSLALVRAARGHALVNRVRQLYPDQDRWYLEGLLGLLGAGANYLMLRTRLDHDGETPDQAHDERWRGLHRVIRRMLGVAGADHAP